jgi:16S rRNA (guanine966-N2)-methyltransferase
LSGLRIIAGSAKGMRISAVPGDTTRPITDRVKESLFDIIGNDINKAAMLDLFGGTGSVGIEALSRGAAFVQFIEINQKAVQIIHKNLEHTRLGNKGQVSFSDAFAYITRIPDHKFEYIYIAPPQYQNHWEKALLLLDKNPGWATADAWVIVQIHPTEYKKLELTNFIEFEQRKYGSTLLVFFETLTESTD